MNKLPAIHPPTSQQAKCRIFIPKEILPHEAQAPDYLSGVPSDHALVTEWLFPAQEGNAMLLDHFPSDKRD